MQLAPEPSRDEVVTADEELLIRKIHAAHLDTFPLLENDQKHQLVRAAIIWWYSQRSPHWYMVVLTAITTLVYGGTHSDYHTDIW